MQAPPMRWLCLTNCIAWFMLWSKCFIWIKYKLNHVFISSWALSPYKPIFNGEFYPWVCNSWMAPFTTLLLSSSCYFLSFNSKPAIESVGQRFWITSPTLLTAKPSLKPFVMKLQLKFIIYHSKKRKKSLHLSHKHDNWQSIKYNTNQLNNFLFLYINSVILNYDFEIICSTLSRGVIF